MTTDSTEKPADDPNGEHKFNRKEVMHLGFQNKTRGEAAFNFISYVGDGYGVVTALSVLATWLMNDKVPALGRNIRNFAKETCRMPASAGTILTLFIGGTIASVLPVKWLEDRKPTGVKKLDYLLYSEDEFYHDPKIQAAHKELDELPKQTWFSVLGSRVVAFAATFAVFFAMGSNKSPLAKFTGHSLDELSIRAGRKFDGWMNAKNNEALAEIARVIEHNESKAPLFHGKRKLPAYEIVNDTLGVKDDRIASRVYSYIALDGFYTAITSLSLWVSTRVFGAMVGQDAKQAKAIAERKHAPKATALGTAISTVAPDMANTAAEAPTADAPPTKITQPVHIDRVAEPHHHAELTA